MCAGRARTWSRKCAPWLPYAGIRVVEFTRMVMGPTCGMLLGDLGAEAIKALQAGPGCGKFTKWPTS